ncbi:MAG: FAD-dependent oxidoreductase, partial [Proteobacteria bacterium]|nr:FAD-dependent oxidoreductase [Pseudomonadota bacterium]
MAHVIIIGAGQAGYSCAGRLRGDGFDGDITLVGTESAPPYQRPPLSKGYLLGALETERLYLRPMSFYQDNNITLRLNQTASKVDSTAQTITINDEVLHYTDLVFTTGSEPRRLPDAVGGGLGGVYTLRGLDCVNRLRGEFKKDQHLLIIGGGYIGLETAAVARQMGLRVSLIEMSERILQRVAAPQTSDFFRTLHTEHGTDIIEGVGLKTLLGDTRVSQAELTDGRILDIDFAIAGIGIMPRTELAESTGITLDNGIKTDEFGRTSHPHIWAAGDCASFPY